MMCTFSCINMYEGNHRKIIALFKIAMKVELLKYFFITTKAMLHISFNFGSNSKTWLEIYSMGIFS